MDCRHARAQETTAAKAVSAERCPRPGLMQQFLGWCVHGYTALGLVAAALIAVLLVQGGADAYRWSFILMVIATFVDATDGTLARRVRIKEAVPSFDGRRLDDLVDFLNYTCLPLLLVWRARLLPEGYEPWLLLPLVASAYGFCQVERQDPRWIFPGLSVTLERRRTFTFTFCPVGAGPH